MVSLSPRMMFVGVMFISVMIMSCYGKGTTSETDHQTELERVIDQDTIRKLIENVELQNGLIQKLQDRVDSLHTENLALTKRIEYLESRDKSMRAEQQKAGSSRDTNSNSKISNKSTMDIRGKWLGLSQSKTKSPERISADIPVHRPLDMDGLAEHADASTIIDGSGELPMGKQKRQTTDGPNSAFLAVLETHIHHQGEDQIVNLDYVMTDIGGNYNRNVGTFTAPVRGTYVFSVSVMAYIDTTSHYYISHNGLLVVGLVVHGEDSPNISNSKTVVLELDAGDDVAVRNMGTEDTSLDTSLHGNYYSSFCGYLLHAHSDYAAAVG